MCLADFFIRFYPVSNINQAGRYFGERRNPLSGNTNQGNVGNKGKKGGTDKEIGKERLDAPGCPTLNISSV